MQVQHINLSGQIVIEPERSAPLWEAQTSQPSAKSTQTLTPKSTQGSRAQVCASASLFSAKSVLMRAMN